MSMTGKCLCAAVKFTVHEAETGFHSCHCATCRRWSGGPAMAAAVSEPDFEGIENIARYASSDWAERGFCKLCGSHLFYYLKPRNQYMMWTGAFDDPTAFRMSGEIFIEEKPPGYAFAGEHPRMTGEDFMRAMGYAD